MNFRQIFSIVFFIYLCSNIYSQRAPHKIKYEYLLYTPEEYSSGKKEYPLVIYLHGASLRGNNINEIKAYGLPFLVEKGYSYEFFIASPQCPKNKNWITDDWFEMFYQDLITKYRIDTNRVYLIGMSLGGYGVWQLTMKYPGRFAAVVPICGGYFDYKNICTIKDIPVWAFHGAEDKIVDVNETECLVSELEACHGRIKYTRLEGKGHDLTYLFKDEGIYTWMLKHKKIQK